MTPTSPLRRTVATLLPILILAGGIPALALFGVGDIVLDPVNLVENAITAGFQELINDTIQNQLDHLEEKAMGEIGKLTESFDFLSADRMALLGLPTDLAWSTDFTGQPRQLLDAVADMQDDSDNSLLTYTRQDLAAVDTISRQRYANTFPDTRASDTWTANREAADRTLATDFVILDTAESTIEHLGHLSESLERSRQQTNVSDTALAQELNALLLNLIEGNLAMTQLTAQHSLRTALETYKLERAHRAQLETWVTAERAEARQADRAQNRIRGQRNAWRQAFLLD